MSTFLELAQDWRRNCGIAGSGPSSVIAQSEEITRGVKWLRDSYVEIQNDQPHWRWLRSEFTVDTVQDDDEYAYTDCTDTIASAAISRFARWWVDDMKIYLTSSGVGTQTWMTHMDWSEFKRLFKVGSQTSGFPGFFSIDPREKLLLGAKPNGIYTVTGDYQKSPQVLAADDDEPEMPARFHQLIVYYAMRKYAAYMGAPDVWAEVKDQAATMMRDLRVSQIPTTQFAGPLC